MDFKHQTITEVRAAALEHLTGPLRGNVTWLNEPSMGISLSPDHTIRIAKTPDDQQQDDALARFHRANDRYEIQASEGQTIWVNGKPISTTHQLEHSDLIEFGETGPVTRIRFCRDEIPAKATISEIMSDAVAYLRVSRQPLAVRIFRALCQVVRRLAVQTTVLFRVGVVVALIIFAGLLYQQSLINTLLMQRLDSASKQLENFAGALVRAREKAVTAKDLQKLQEEIGQRLHSEEQRITALEQRTLASRHIIAQATPSIVFLLGAYGFRENASARMLRHVLDATGRPLISPRGQPLLSLEGQGPVAERQFIGTGFAVGDAGMLVTNRHVAVPWENDAIAQALPGQLFEPVMIKFIAYRPNFSTANNVSLVQASEEVDLAILRHEEGTPSIPGLQLAEELPKPGDDVIVMGYPTGLRSMLAQSGAAFIQELQKTTKVEFWKVAALLAEGGHIAPLASRGIVGQISSATIVYDAETTHGGSGGPVFDINGHVVAVNVAILPEFGGSNLGIPIANVRTLLAEIN